MNSSEHQLRLTPDDLRLAAAALSKSEWREHMRDMLFVIDTGVKDGLEDNKKLIAIYLEEKNQ
jgi:hypothetical protein